MKKIILAISALITAALLICIIPVFSAMADNVTSCEFVLTPDKTTVAVGEDVTYTFSIKPNGDVYALQAFLKLPKGFTIVENSVTLTDGLNERLKWDDIAVTQSKAKALVFFSGFTALNPYKDAQELKIASFTCTVTSDAESSSAPSLENFFVLDKNMAEPAELTTKFLPVTIGNDTPSNPDSSDEPSVPDSSEEPSVPDSSDEPSVPDSSDEPSVSDSSDEPSVPDSSDEPSVPDSSDDSSVPDSSDDTSTTVRPGPIPIQTYVPAVVETFSDTESTSNDSETSDTSTASESSETSTTSETSTASETSIDPETSSSSAVSESSGTSATETENTSNSSEPADSAVEPDTANTSNTSNTVNNPPKGAGKVVVDVQLSGNTPNMDITTSPDDLPEILLTQEEQELFKDGYNLRVILSASNDESLISDADKSTFASALESLGDYEAAEYFDISLHKTISGHTNQITVTNKPVSFSIEIPEAFRDNSREYKLIRIHDGKADVLNDIDHNYNTITVESDRFSTYALIYHNKAASGNEVPYTGIESSWPIFAAVCVVALLICVLLFFTTGKNGMSEEKKEKTFAKLIAWGKRGGKIRSVIALALIGILLVFYYGIGMKISDHKHM